MIKVLFVESDPIVLGNMRRVLSIMKRQWEMRFVANAEEALQALSEHPFDVVCASLSLPTLSGLELLGVVKQQHPRLVRVLLSEPYESAATARGVGVAHRLLRKPFDPAELHEALLRTFDMQQRLHDPELELMISELGFLPAPSATITALNEVLASPEADLGHVADIVSSDMAMTTKLLQLVNSAYFGLYHSVSDVREAVSFLGMESVRNVALATDMLRSFNQVPSVTQGAVDELHERSLTVAHIARELAPDRHMANDAFVAALLHDVGLLVVASQMPERFLDLQVHTMRCNLSLTEVEMEVVGAHHADIGAHLLNLWGLPSNIVEAVLCHHDPLEGLGHTMSPSHAVRIAEAVVEEDGNGELAQDYLGRLGIDRDKVASL